MRMTRDFQVNYKGAYWPMPVILVFVLAEIFIWVKFPIHPLPFVMLSFVLFFCFIWNVTFLFRNVGRAAIKITSESLDYFPPSLLYHPRLSIPFSAVLDVRYSEDFLTGSRPPIEIVLIKGTLKTISRPRQMPGVLMFREGADGSLDTVPESVWINLSCCEMSPKDILRELKSILKDTILKNSMGVITPCAKTR